MKTTYWAIFALSLFGLVFFAVCSLLGFLFLKKVFSKPSGIWKFTILQIVSIVMITLLFPLFLDCCKDYSYVINDRYEEAVGEVVEFTYVKRDLDGNGQLIQSKPKFYLHERDVYVVLYAKDVEIGELYSLKYYPNTKICEVVHVPRE